MDKLLARILPALTGGAAVVGSVSATAALAGIVYIVDCRITAGRNFEKANSCYLSGLPMMGLGLGVGGGWKAGYETYNPRLRRRRDEDEDDRPRDSHGRYIKRER